jgi:hypothetical protein
MRIDPALSILLVLAFPGQSFGHRLDEYLQATTISVEKDRIAVEMRLSPGVAVAPFVLSRIDRNGDGIISPAEEAAYVGELLGDVALTLDGDALPLHLVSKTFARIDDMREGMGDIHLSFIANIPRRDVAARKLIFENSHCKQIAAYLVNAIVPSDPDIRITGQTRDFKQSSYRLDYSQAGVAFGPFSLASWSGQRVGLIALALLMTIRFACAWWRRQRANANSLAPTDGRRAAMFEFNRHGVHLTRGGNGPAVDGCTAWPGESPAQNHTRRRSGDR